jgi:hypothetical protein
LLLQRRLVDRLGQAPIHPQLKLKVLKLHKYQQLFLNTLGEGG